MKLNRINSPFISSKLVIKVAGLSLLCIVAGAHAADNTNVIEMRQQSFKKMGGAMKAINEELKADQADSARIKTSAQTLVDKSQELHTWFPAGSGQESGEETDALAYIWQNTEKFASSADNLIVAAKKLNQLVSTNETEALGKQLKEVKDTCSACHKNFRAD